MKYCFSLLTDVSWNLQPVLNATYVLVGLEAVGSTTDYVTQRMNCSLLFHVSTVQIIEINRSLPVHALTFYISGSLSHY